MAYAGFQRTAGNFVIIRSTTLRRDFACMHMQSLPLVRKGQTVAPGQTVGLVGDTGNASGCHLHFEIWKGKWYRGGRDIVWLAGSAR